MAARANRPTLLRRQAWLALFLPLMATAAEKPGDGHHPPMAEATSAFHHLMEPLWHMPPGSARIGQACARSGEMDRRLRAMTAEHGPKRVLGLMADTVRSLGEACKASRGASVERELHALHQQFHQLMGM